MYFHEADIASEVEWPDAAKAIEMWRAEKIYYLQYIYFNYFNKSSDDVSVAQLLHIYFLRERSSVYARVMCSYPRLG